MKYSSNEEDTVSTKRRTALPSGNMKFTDGPFSNLLLTFVGKESPDLTETFENNNKRYNYF